MRDHLAWGYPDQPPLSIYLLELSRFAFGDSLVGLRLLPALASSATIFFTGLLARELGGGRFAQVMAALAAYCSLILTAMAGFYSMNVFDILLWSIASYVVLRIVTIKRPELWLVLGVVVGLGALNKIHMLSLGAGVAVGLLLTEQRQ